jgi:hypothetical protein
MNERKDRRCCKDRKPAMDFDLSITSVGLKIRNKIVGLLSS